MGLHSVAYICQRVTNAVVYMHKNIGFWSINYLDDFGSAEQGHLEQESYDVMTFVMNNIGVKEAEDKAVPPKTRMEFLGNTMDTVKFTLEVSEHRRIELQSLLNLWENKQMYSKKELQSLIGKLSFITNCVRPDRIFLARMLESLRSCAEVHNKVDCEMLKDIIWWRNFLPTFDGISILWLDDSLPPGALMALDASMTGGRAVHKQEFFHVKFPEFVKHKATNIAQLELFTVMLAIKMWASDLEGKVVRFYTDNANAMYTINKGHTRDGVMLECIRQITWFTAKHQVLLWAVFIRSKDNILPDALSRWYQSSEARCMVRRITHNKWRRSINYEHMSFNQLR